MFLVNGVSTTHCCGIRGIYNFPRYSNRQANELRQTILTQRDYGFRGVIECTLTTRKTKWPEFLLEIGFTEVNRFKNPATGNTVVVYHLIEDKYKV